MKILILNQEWFAADWRKAGHEVVTFGFNDGVDVKVEAGILNFADVLRTLPAGFKPDRIVFHDNSMPLHYFGFEQLEMPIVFYSVDAHHHIEFHKHLGNLVDFCLVAQHDYVRDFHNVGAKAAWLPLWASRYLEPASEKRHDAVFIGNLNAKLNPERVAFFEQLQKITPIVCTVGNFWEYFPYAEIVLNQCVRNDLNFRMFEGMMSGAMMLSDRPANGFAQLFKEGEHLVIYEKGNPQHAAELIKQYLADRESARRIATRARELILAKHTESVRAAEALTHVLAAQKRETKVPLLSKVASYMVAAVKMEKSGSNAAPRALVEAMSAADEALRAGEILTDEVANYIVVGCCRYDALFKTSTGEDLLNRYFEAFPQSGMLALAVIRNLLNRGERAKATEIASYFAVDDVRKVFEAAEDAVRQLLTPSLKYEMGRIGVE